MCFFRYKKYIEELKVFLEKISFIAVTTDLWKNLKLEYFLTITGHFYLENFEYTSLILSFRKFSVAHDANNIRKFIIQELTRLNILNKVVSITTDNEAAVKSAGSKIGEHVKWISCLCHNMNLIAQNGLQLWKNPKKYCL